MTVLYDSIDATAIPRDAAAVAGYGDGLFVWSPSWKDGTNWWSLFPDAAQLVIVVNPAHQGDVLDVETSDAAPSDVPGWVRRFSRPARRRPTVYSSRTVWPQVVTALEAAGMSAAAVDWWAATLDGTQTVAGAVAVQYQDVGTYDISNVQDESWLGGAMALDPSNPNDAAVIAAANTINNIAKLTVDPNGQPIGLDYATSYILSTLLKVPAGGGMTAAQAGQLAAAEAGVARIEAALKAAGVALQGS